MVAGDDYAASRDLARAPRPEAEKEPRPQAHVERRSPIEKFPPTANHGLIIAAQGAAAASGSVALDNAVAVLVEVLGGKLEQLGVFEGNYLVPKASGDMVIITWT